MKPIRYFFFVVLLWLMVAGCQTTAPVAESPAETDHRTGVEQMFDESEVFNQSNTGFVLYDPATGDTLTDRSGHRYFTPASNMKIFTLYAGLKMLPEAFPGLRYHVQNDTLYFRGTGDPGFLNPEFEPQPVFDFLSSRTETLVYYDAHFDDDFFGSGWPWDWHSAAYAPEKTPFPIYGNMMRFQVEQVASIQLDQQNPVKPAIFEQFITNQGWNGQQSELIKRELRDNEVLYQPRTDTARQERIIPFIYSPELITELLADTLGRDVHLATERIQGFDQAIAGTSVEEALRRMMVESDNFVAEQTLLAISEQEFGNMNSARAIAKALDEHFGFLDDRPSWNDGSGLTRYNLVTPWSVITMLDRLWIEYGEEVTLSMFPVGGQTGTLRGWYQTEEGEPPYVYAKTGTLRNNTSLSGYIFTDSGRRLLFSFQNNNYVISNNAMRAEMQNLLQFVKTRY
ncbi:MAG: D-alanyl-D-alanine carboxypeptidase/D-alanyl-D-alanine-endopeptidase [Balneolaceae bacterium]